MNKQLLKTFNGYVITYHSDRKTNPFVVTDHGKVVEKFADFSSSMAWVYHHIPNFERMMTHDK
jgi:hypothetical protein